MKPPEILDDVAGVGGVCKPVPGLSVCPMPISQERKEPFQHTRATGNCQSSHQRSYKNSSCSRLVHKAYNPIYLEFRPSKRVKAMPVTAMRHQNGPFPGAFTWRIGL